MTVLIRTKVRFGKVCEKHPELKGERWLSDNRCVECKRLRCVARRLADRGKVAEYNKKYKSANRDKVLAKNREYMHTYKHTETFKISRKTGKVIRERGLADQKISTFYKDEISKIYKGCPIGYHVDHIVPLKGKNVIGLHVPWNMQYLTAKDNISKGIKFDRA